MNECTKIQAKAQIVRVALELGELGFEGGNRLPFLAGSVAGPMQILPSLAGWSCRFPVPSPKLILSGPARERGERLPIHLSD